MNKSLFKELLSIQFFFLLGHRNIKEHANNTRKEVGRERGSCENLAQCDALQE